MKRTFLIPLTLLCVVVTVGCTNSETPETVSDVPTVAATPTPQIHTYTFKAGQVTGPSTITVKQGDAVTIVLTADAGENVHVHGIQAEKQIVPNQPVELSFVAETAGRFEIEIHSPDKTIGVIEVQPK